MVRAVAVRADGPAVTVVVPVVGREELAFAELAGRPLLDHAVEAVAGLAGARIVVVVGDDAGGVPELDHLARGAVVCRASDWWTDVARTAPLLVHDPLCPLSPAASLEAALTLALDRPGIAVVGFRPVTDTVKVVEHGVIAGTVDRDGLASIATPLVIGAAVVAALPGAPDLTDLAATVADLRRGWPVELIGVPSIARRVDTAEALHLLRGIAVTTSR